MELVKLLPLFATSISSASFLGTFRRSFQRSAAMASSKRWASVICSIASLTFFAVIIFQVPIFRVPCRSGICKTPLEVTSCQLIASDLFPLFIVKALLYPGALARAFYKQKAIPSFRNLLKLYKFNIMPTSATSDLQRLEILAGSYLSVAGAIVGLIKPGRMSLFGILIVIWGLVREMMMGKYAGLSAHAAKGIYIYPEMWIALVSAVLSIRRDVRKIVRSFKGKDFVKEKRF